MTWLVTALNWICMFFDAIVYQFVAIMYNIFLAIVRVDFGDINNIFDNVLTRLYLVLSVFMLFKISFSLLQMLVDPEMAKNSTTGGSALVKRIFISIVMLIAFPLVFDILHDVQVAIVENATIQKIILGSTSESLNTAAAGPSFSWSLLSSFARPQGDGKWSETTGKVKTAYDKIWNGSDYSLMQLVPVINDTQLTYTPIISTIAGAVVVFYLLSFSMDIGLRSFKLMFLETIAPIPIITYMSPKKDGSSAFDKYKKMYITTYVDLFIRLACVYLVLLLANKVMYLVNNGQLALNLGDNIPLTGLSAKIAAIILIVALFHFAKQIPNLVSGMLGFEQSTSAFGGAAIAGLAGAAGLAGGAIGGLVGGAGGAIMQGINTGQGAGLIAQNALAGGLGGIARGAYGGASAGLSTRSAANMYKNVTGGIGKGMARQNLSNAANFAAGGLAARYLGGIDNALGGATRAQTRDKRAQEQASSAIAGIQGSQAYQDAEANIGDANMNVYDAEQDLSAAQSGLSAAQGAFNGVDSDLSAAMAAQTEASDTMGLVQGVRDAVTNSYAADYGISYADAQSALSDDSAYNAQLNLAMESGNADVVSAMDALTSATGSSAADLMGTDTNGNYNISSYESQVMSDYSSASATVEDLQADLASAHTDVVAAQSVVNLRAGEVQAADIARDQAQATMDNYSKQFESINTRAQNHGISDPKKLANYNKRLERQEAARKAQDIMNGKKSA